MSANFRWKGSSPPTIVGISKLVFLLSHSEDRMFISSFVEIWYQRVTVGRKDRRTDGIAMVNTTLCIASNAAAL